MADPKTPRIIFSEADYLAEYAKLKKMEIDKQRILIELAVLPENEQTDKILQLAEIELAIPEIKETLARSFDMADRTEMTKERKIKLQETVNGEYVNSTPNIQITFENPTRYALLRSDYLQYLQIEYENNMQNVTITLKNNTVEAYRALMEVLDDAHENDDNIHFSKVKITLGKSQPETPHQSLANQSAPDPKASEPEPEPEPTRFRPT